MSRDGTVRIAIEVDGKQVDVASKSLDKLESAAYKTGKGAKTAEDGMKGVGQESTRAGGGIRKFASSLGLVAVGAVAFNTLRGSLDSAISRFDTLNQFPRVLQAMGVSAEDAESSINNLSEGIDGLPTKLDDIASTAQRMYTSFGSMDKATQSALALNNALLSQSASAESVSRGTEQYLKVLQTGQMDLMTWRSLSETMDVGLVKLAESFGYVGETAKDDLYNALKEGEVTIGEFNNKLIELGTGTGDLAKLAKENSLGLATSLINLRTAVSRNVANIIESFNKLVNDVTGDDIAVHLDNLKVVINSAFKFITRTIERSTPVVKFFGDVLMSLLPIIRTVSPALIGLASAYAIHSVIHATASAIRASETAMLIATVAKRAYILVTNQQAASEAFLAAQMRLSSIVLVAYNKAIALATTVQAMLASGMSLTSIAAVGLSGAIHVLNVAIKALMGPVGWITAGIGLLGGAVVGIVKWFKRSSDEAEKYKEEIEELDKATKDLTGSVESNQKAFKENQRNVTSAAKANEEMLKKVQELANVENKSAAEKALLKSYTEQLNKSMDGLNLSYDDEVDKLNMSSEHIKARIDLFKEQEKAQMAQDRLVEIIQEQAMVEEHLEEVIKKRKEAENDSSLSKSEAAETTSDLIEQEKNLIEVLDDLSDQYVETEELIEVTMKGVAEATERAIDSQIIDYDRLKEHQKQAVDGMKDTWEDYKDHATEMFDVLSDEAVFTIDEMTKNLQENQRIIGEWADGIAKLAERGVDEGLLDKLREAGPESAGHVNALVKASDTELQKLSETFAKGGDAATEALSKSLGIDKTNILKSIEHLVVDTEKSLREQVKSANFEGIGADVVEGVSGGVDEKAYKAEDAARKMAEDMVDTTKDTLGISSPSKVYKEFGGDVTDGLSLGISGGTSKVINSAKDLYKSMRKKFDNIYTDFNRIGLDAMSGLNAGLNSGRKSVLSRARSIANDIRGTMQSALRIQSPSKVMEEEVGKWIPEGVAVGIEDNASSVFKAIGDLSSRMVKFSSPELALGASMGYSGRLGNSISNTSTSNVQNTNQTVNMEGMFNGAVFNVRDDQDIEKLAKELGDYINGKSRSMGVVIKPF